MVQEGHARVAYRRGGVRPVADRIGQRQLQQVADGDADVLLTALREAEPLGVGSLAGGAALLVGQQVGPEDRLRGRAERTPREADKTVLPDLFQISAEVLLEVRHGLARRVSRGGAAQDVGIVVRLLDQNRQIDVLPAADDEGLELRLGPDRGVADRKGQCFEKGVGRAPVDAHAPHHFLERQVQLLHHGGRALGRTRWVFRSAHRSYLPSLSLDKRIAAVRRLMG